jgi:hypothetical protein
MDLITGKLKVTAYAPVSQIYELSDRLIPSHKDMLVES